MLFDGRHSYINKYESNASMLSRVIIYIQSVNFLFLFSICYLLRRLSFFMSETEVLLIMRCFSIEKRLQRKEKYTADLPTHSLKEARSLFS